MRTVLLILAGLIIFPTIAHADTAPPSKYVTLYFEQEGRPVNDPIDFTIRCFGQTYDYQFNLNEEIIEVSDYSDTCQSYGCSFGLANTLDVYRTEERYCNISGTVNNQEFMIDNFLGDDLDYLECDRAGYDMFDGEYWRRTPEYDQCIEDTDYDFDECRQYYEMVTDQLALNDEGFAYEETCDIKIDVPDDMVISDDQTPIYQPEVHDPNQRDIQLPINQPWYIRWLNAIRCVFTSVFGQPCR